MAEFSIQSPVDGGNSKPVTTFVQADSECFRDLVQRLTGPSSKPLNTAPVKSPAPKPAKKLHERRKYTKPRLEIAKPTGFLQTGKMPVSPTMVPALSPGRYYGRSLSGYPLSPASVMMMSSAPGSLQASPVTSPAPRVCSYKRASPSPVQLNPAEEEKAIKEKRFYLHPSPRSKPRLGGEPELLTLFPLSSPTASEKNKA